MLQLLGFPLDFNTSFKSFHYYVKESSDSAVLDVSKLKDHDFSDVNLSDTTADMDTKIDTLRTTLNTAGLVDSTAHTLINATTASTAMKTYVADATLKSNAKFTAEYLSGKTFYVVSH